MNQSMSEGKKGTALRHELENITSSRIKQDTGYEWICRIKVFFTRYFLSGFENGL